MPKTATLVRFLNTRQNLYRVDPPMEWTSCEAGADDTCVKETSYVVSSYGIYEVETYLFPADADGNIINWIELPGSFRGDYNHVEALENAGYAATVSSAATFGKGGA